MIPWKLLDKTANVSRQTPGAGTAALATVARGIKCCFYDGSGWSPGPEGGHFQQPTTIYLVDFNGTTIPGGIQPGDFLAVTVVKTVVNLVVRGVKIFNNTKLTRSGVLYVANCEPAPSGNL